MTTPPPRISRVSAWLLGLLLAVMLSAGPIPLFFSVILPYLETGHFAGDWNLSRIMLTLATVFACFGYLGFIGYQRFSTVISEQGISFLTIRGRQQIRWTDIRSARTRGYEILLSSAEHTACVNTACFQDPGALFAYIDARLPHNARQPAP